MASGDNHTLRIVDGCHDSSATATALQQWDVLTITLGMC